MILVHSSRSHARVVLCYPSHRETMLQALRFVIQGAGSKVDPAIRKNITTTLLGMLGHDEVCQGGADALQQQLELRRFLLICANTPCFFFHPGGQLKLLNK